MKCFCGSNMYEFFIGKTKYKKCDSCGYIEKLNLVSSFDEKKRYDLHICDDAYLDYMASVYQAIKKYVGYEVLDYGCGQVHALSDLINNDNKKCDYYDLYYYPKLNNKKYDSIILIEVFEHIREQYILIMNLKNMLNPCGNIIIMSQVCKEDFSKWWYIRDITHVSFVTVKSMEYIASSLGFSLFFDEKSSVFVLSSIKWYRWFLCLSTLLKIMKH